MDDSEPSADIPRPTVAARLIPVLDLKQGWAVHAVAGQRQHYQPLQGPCFPSADPVAVAEVYRDRWGFAELYVADLDAIVEAKPQWSLLQRLHDRGFRLRVDVGLRTGDEARRLADLGVETLVIGLESWRQLDRLAECVDLLGATRVQFSLDLFEGQPLVPPGTPATWLLPSDGLAHTPDEPADRTSTGLAWARHIAAQASAAGVRRLLLLDLAAVGRTAGVPTLSLCREVQSLGFEELTAGGGVRDPADVQRLAEAGVHSVLVGTALHAGRLDELVRRVNW